MANPRRSSYSNNPSSERSSYSNNPSSERSSYSNNPSSENPLQTHFLSLSSLIYFLKRPHAFPFLLSVFILLTWVFLRLQHLQYFSFHQQDQYQENQKWRREDDGKANLVRFSSGFPSPISRDRRGWLLNPVTAANEAGISGGAITCASVHVGEIRPGGVRGNHRHHSCNETFIIWGAKTKFRLENNDIVGKGYAEVTFSAKELAIAASPSGTAHALVNVDPVWTTFFLGCQDSILTYNSSTTDFNVWNDL